MISMSRPFFYIDAYDGVQSQVVLNEETSKHVVQVLRMKIGEELNLTDGKGSLLQCQIVDDNRKQCRVVIQSKTDNPKPPKEITIAISLLKNTNRFEWFLEKATEIGVAEIIPLLCERTEKDKFRFERLNGICISAMLQSQQTWLPVLREPVEYSKWIVESASAQKFIAHCENEETKQVLSAALLSPTDRLICIGPEGDFSTAEITLAMKNGFIPVSLGETRLRTETAGVVAATLLIV
jgi:16S rRNA (uracil1498-N3)-methyltransferase